MLSHARYVPHARPPRGPPTERLSFARPLSEAVTGSVGRPAEDDAVGKHRVALGDRPQAGLVEGASLGKGVEGETLNPRTGAC